MRAAGKALDRRLGISWERRQLARAKNTPECTVRLDRLEVTASAFPAKLILEIPSLSRTSDGLMRRRHPEDFLPYRRMSILTGTASVLSILVCYQPTMRNLAACKFTFVARDHSGLEWKDVRSVLEFLPDSKIVLAELAFDFGFASGIATRCFIGALRKKGILCPC